jgi:hypothetical protein
MSATFDARSQATKRAWVTRNSAKYGAHRSERASKEALREWCRQAGWKVIFFEGATGAARTGIVDAIIARIRRCEPDGIDVRLVQLKAGAGGLTAAEITRMKLAAENLSLDWLLCAFDGQNLHFLPDVPHAEGTANQAVQRTRASRFARGVMRTSPAAGSGR